MSGVSNTRGVSVVLPTYNEAANIVHLVNSIIDFMPAELPLEIIVVDDNSPDGTYMKVCDTFEGDNRIRPILRETGRGFAKSIRHGIEAARHPRLIVMDTDLTHDPVEIPQLLHVGAIYDLVSGSRFCAGGRMVDTGHYVVSMLFNWVIRLLLRTQVQDNLGGYYTADRERVLALPLDDIFRGYGEYYFRLLFYAQRAGMSVVEIPAYYNLRSYGVSKSNWLRMIWSYTSAAIALRVRYWRS